MLSVILTVVLNVGLRMFPQAGDRAARKIAEMAAPRDDDPTRRQDRVRVYAPWKAMLIGSLVLTILLNVVLRLF
jgi:hypothetical protein